MTGRIGVAFEGKEPPGDAARMAATMDARGVTTLWLASHLFQREPIVRAALTLAATQRLRIALMAMSPYSVHPVYATMAAATLDEMFPGRVTLCFGVGAPRDLEAAGLVAQAPLQTIRETLAIARALLAGETIHHQGERFKVAGRRLNTGPHALPLVVAASGPQMLELAGAEADGVLISAATSIPFVRWCLDLVAKGEARAGRRIQRIGLVYAAVADREAEAHARLRRIMAFILRGAHHARNLELGGSQLDQAALGAAFGAERWDDVDRMMTDDIVARHAASGTAEQVRDRFAQYNAAGLDEIVLAGQADEPGLRYLLERIGPAGEGER